MTHARIAPGSRRDIGWLVTAFARISGRFTGTGPPAIFTTLGKSGRLFWGWLVYSAMMMPFGRLSRRETELVILRIAHLRRCEYERRHHEGLARRAGVPRYDIDRIGHADLSSWQARDRAILHAATQFVEQRDINDTAWAQLSTHLDESQIIELLLLCGHYDSLATTLLTLRTRPDQLLDGGTP